MAIYNCTHSQCDDGLASAWIMKRAYPKIETIFSTYSHEWKHHNFNSGDEIFFTDFSPEPEDAVELINQGVEFLVIDHHLTAQEKLNAFKDKKSIQNHYRLNMEFCGAVLTWKHFFRNESMPELLEYINISDMWQWDERDDSREVCAWNRHNLVMNDIGSFQKLYETWSLTEAREKGALLVDQVNRLVTRLATPRYELNFDGTLVHAMNDSLFPSDLGHEFEKTSPSGIGVTYYVSPVNGIVKVSARGKGAKEFCERYGGGGHPLAAGFVMNMKEFMRFLETAKSVKRERVINSRLDAVE